MVPLLLAAALAAPPAPEPRVVPVGAWPEAAPVSLIPADASLTDVRRLGGGVLAVTWERSFGSKPPFRDFGFAVWQREGPRERRVFRLRAREGTNGDPQGGVEALSMTAGDVTGDGRADALVYEYTDGSAGCGVYLLVDRTRVLYRRRLCIDHGTIAVIEHALIVKTGFAKDPKTRNGIHCCYLKVRTTQIRWRAGHRTATSSVAPNHGTWPPGN
jgi:hypothetical protein